jgi:hypothetical protein
VLKALDIMPEHGASQERLSKPIQSGPGEGEWEMCGGTTQLKHPSMASQRPPRTQVMVVQHEKKKPNHTSVHMIETVSLSRR